MQSVQMHRNAVAVSICLSAGSAMAGGAVFTPIQASVNPTERDHQTIFGEYFGSPFNQVGLDFINDNLSLIRVADDGLPSPLNLFTDNASNRDDQVFQAQSISVELISSEADDSHRFGIRQDSTGNAFEELISTDGGPTVGTTTANSDFRFSLINDTTSKSFTSVIDSNGSFFGPKFDQLVTYEVQPNIRSGLEPGARQWVLAWEDRIGQQAFADYDFNDVVVIVTVIPSPASAGLLGLAGLTALTGRNRKG